MKSSNQKISRMCISPVLTVSNKWDDSDDDDNVLVDDDDDDNMMTEM